MWVRVDWARHRPCFTPLVTTMEVKAMDKCTHCGALNDMFAPVCYKCRKTIASGGQVAVAERKRTAEKCRACGKPQSALTAVSHKCEHCGWDSDRGLRKCTKCDGLVAFDDADLGHSRGGGAEAAWPLGGVFAAVAVREIGYLLGYAFGLLSVLALLFGILALAGTFKAALSHYRCSMCGHSPSVSFLTTEELRRLRGHRTKWTVLTLVFVGVALGCVAFRQSFGV